MDKLYAHHVPLRNRIGSPLGFIILGLCLLTLASCGGAGSFLPPPLTDLELGVPSADILKKIGTAGKVTTTPASQPGRAQLTWIVPVSPWFKRIEMEFTEKDRMYLARFVVKDEARLDVTTIKQKLFDRYKISWEEPNRMTRKNVDVLVYSPEEQDGKTVLFEMTSTANGEKSLELFATDISKEDRQKAKQAAQAEPGDKKAPGPAVEGNAKPKSEAAPRAEGAALAAPPADK